MNSKFHAFLFLLFCVFSALHLRAQSCTSIITTIVGGGNLGDGGAATAALLFSPVAVAVDSIGNLYIGIPKD